MQARQTILDLWQRAVTQGVAVTFINTYGWSTAQSRFEETQDAFSREDDVRIVKSCLQLLDDTPALQEVLAWPAIVAVQRIAEHALEDDYPSRKGVASSTRDPNINMYSEAVAPNDNIQEGGEPTPDVSLGELIDTSNIYQELDEDDTSPDHTE